MLLPRRGAKQRQQSPQLASDLPLVWSLFVFGWRRKEARPQVDHLLAFVLGWLAKAGANETRQPDGGQGLPGGHLLDPKCGDALAKMRAERGALGQRARVAKGEQRFDRSPRARLCDRPRLPGVKR